MVAPGPGAICDLAVPLELQGAVVKFIDKDVDTTSCLSQRAP